MNLNTKFLPQRVPFQYFSTEQSHFKELLVFLQKVCCVSV